MGDAWLVGTASTPFQRHPGRSLASLSEEVVRGALGDARAGGQAVERVFFGNCAMHTWGQSNIRGQVALGGLFRAGELSADAAVVNIEAACATGSATLAAAVEAVRGGAVHTALAVGAEKVFHPDDPVATFGVFLSGADVAAREAWLGHVAAEAEAHGLPFAPHRHRIVFVDIHALQAAWHAKTYGTTWEQVAAVAAKDHAHGALNPKAQYGSPTTAEAVLADKPVGIGRLTRSMCAPVSDGAAAVVVVSDQGLQRLPPEARARAVKVRSCVLTGGRWRGLGEPSVVDRGAARGLAAAGITGADIDIAEVHDAASSCEIEAIEALGLCPHGEGGPFSASGATRLGGEVPVNLSGGLVSKGHPLAATGLGMVDELIAQLRGEGGERQVPGAGIGVAQNAGGLVALDEAVCGVTVLERC